jgi:hypothetical protein
LIQKNKPLQTISIRGVFFEHWRHVDMTYNPIAKLRDILKTHNHTLRDLSIEINGSHYLQEKSLMELFFQK